MNDKELLPLAAKAMGHQHRWSDSYHHGEMRSEILVLPSEGVWFGWNPLIDDGQAFGLAADLRLKILPGRLNGDGCTVESQRQGIAGCTTFRDDKREQMRHAIVHVAAEIGKAMP